MSSVTGAAGQFAGMATAPEERAGAGLGKSVSAWRRVFEREQLAALAKFRSVTTGNPGDSSAYSMPHGQPERTGAVSADALSTPSGRTSWPGGESADVTRVRPAHYASFPGAAKPSMPAGERWAGVWLGQATTSKPSENAVQSFLAPAALHHAATASSGEWPWRRMHCMVDADGVHVWLRDTTIDAQDTLLFGWIGQLHQMLAQSGMRLASFTLNGTAISTIA